MEVLSWGSDQKISHMSMDIFLNGGAIQTNVILTFMYLVIYSFIYLASYLFIS